MSHLQKQSLKEKILFENQETVMKYYSKGGQVAGFERAPIIVIDKTTGAEIKTPELSTGKITIGIRNQIKEAIKILNKLGE